MTAPKRNQLCPCGSGKRYKKCCADSERLQASAPATSPAAPSSEKEKDTAASIFHLHYPGRTESAENYVSLGNHLKDSGHQEDAILCFLKALEIRPEDPVTLSTLGALYNRQSEFIRAESCFRKAIDLDGDAAVLHFNLGVVLKRQQKLNEAASCFQTTLTLAPDYVEAYFNCGVIAHQQGELEKSAEYYRKALEIRPRYVEVINNMGIVSKTQHHMEDAISYFRAACEINPEYTDALNNLADTMYLIGEFEKSEKILRSLVSKQLADPTTYYLFGRFYTSQARYGEAVHYYSKALAENPEDPNALIGSAITEWIRGETLSCKKALQKIPDLFTKLTQEEKKYIAPYHRFLNILLDYHESHPDLYPSRSLYKNMYLIGDSHCLSAANQIVGKNESVFLDPKIIIGCKAWHLGNQEPNSYKSSFSSIVESLPPRSTVLLMFGEIDTRPYQGIIKNYQKTGEDLEKSVEQLVENYIQFCTGICRQKEMTLMVSNIPAPYIDDKSFDADDISLWIQVVKKFNSALDRLAATSHITILDVYSITGRPDGASHGRYHIDGFHLIPTVYSQRLVELMSPSHDVSLKL